MASNDACNTKQEGYLPMDWFTEGLKHSLAMLWLMLWPMVLGLSISAFLQVFFTSRELEKTFGKTGPKSVLLATGFGAASSSCSYAAVATAKTLFQRGGALVPTLAFMFAATNLVIELGILIWQLMGWVFLVAEVFGGLLMIVIMWALVSVTKPSGLEEEIRTHLTKQKEGDNGHHHHSQHDSDNRENDSLGKRLKQAHRWLRIGQAFFMDVQMLWKEVLIGVLIAGFLSVLVPPEWWRGLFLEGGPKWLRLLENVAVGPLIAVGSFVCSDGNVPLASLLWSNGISFGGVAAFMYGDLLIIPLLLLYRKYFGLKAAIFIAGWLYVSMVLAGLLVDITFGLLGWIPTGLRKSSVMSEAGFNWDYTAWLNIAAIFIATGLMILRWRNTISEKTHVHQKHQQH